jgi:HEAT repeat protein
MQTLASRRVRLPFKLPRRWSVESAIATLQDSKERHRLDAAIWVWSRDAGHFSDEERSRLIDVLRVTAAADDSDAVRNQAVLALVRLEAPGAADLALDALSDPDPMARYTVAAGLGPTGDPRIVDQLIALLDDDDGYVREAAALGLSTQNDPRAIEPLTEILDRGERDSAAKAAAKRRSPR